MREVVVFNQDGNEIRIEASADDSSPKLDGSIGPARSVGEHAVRVVEQSFDAAIAMIGSLADGVAKALDGHRVSETEITLGLKATVKGDFVVVGSTGEAALTIKIKVTPDTRSP